MPFPPWQSIPPTTELRDLFATSLLVLDQDATSGILLRCSPGLEEGSATLVLATTRHPNSLRMMGVDDATQIGTQAQALLRRSRVCVVAVPHITWKSVGRGLPWRTPIAVAITLSSAALMYIPPLSLSPWAAVPVAAIVGMLAWFVLREHIPTRIGPPDVPPMSADAVVERVLLSPGGVPGSGSTAIESRGSSRRWTPPVR